MPVNFTLNNEGTLTGLIVGDYGTLTINSAERAQRVSDLTAQLSELIEHKIIPALPPAEHAQVRSDLAAVSSTAKAAVDDNEAGPRVASLCERLLLSFRKFGDAHAGVATCLSALIALWPTAKAIAGLPG